MENIFDIIFKHPGIYWYEFIDKNDVHYTKIGKSNKDVENRIKKELTYFGVKSIVDGPYISEKYYLCSSLTDDETRINTILSEKYKNYIHKIPYNSKKYY